RQPGAVRVAEATSAVLVRRAGTPTRAQAGDWIRPGDVVRVSSGGSAALRWNQQSTSIQLGQDTEIEALLASDGEAFDLRIGSLAANVGKRSQNAPLTFVTSHARASVIGTRFSLSAVRVAT